MLTTLMKYAMLTTRIGRERIYLDLVSKHRRKFGFSFDMVLLLRWMVMRFVMHSLILPAT